MKIAKIKLWVGSHLTLILPIVIFLAVTLGTWLPRANIPYLFDDTLATIDVKNCLVGEGDPAAMADMTDRFRVIRDTAYNIWYDPGEPLSVYRPLDNLFILKVMFWPYNPLAPTLFHTCVLGATAVLIYLLVLALTKKRFVALGSALLYSLSVPSLVGTWLVIHSQVFTNFFIVLGLLGYVYYVKYGQLRWLSLLWVSGVIAPLFRELSVILPVTVLVLMLAERRWSKPLLISIPLLLGHAIFPSFLPNLILHGQVVIQSAFRGGYAGLVPLKFGRELIPDMISRYTTDGQVMAGHDMPYQLALFIPPIITCLALAGIVWFIFTNRKRLANIRLIVTIAILIMVFLGVFFITGMKVHYVLPLVFFLLIALMSFKFGKFFPIWLLVAGLPFLILYIGFDLHIWAASIPWIIMILLWVDQLVAAVRRWASSVQKRRVLARLAYLVIAAMLFIGFADQCLNVVSVHAAWSEIGGKNREMSERLLRNAPEGGMVVTNFIHGVDIEYCAHSQVKHYPSFNMQGYKMSDRFVYERLAFEKAVSQCFPERGVYLLEETNLFGPAGPLMPHQYVEDPPGDLELEGEFTAQCRYYFLDPLKNLVPPAYYKWTSPPDLHHHFMDPLTGGAFYREFGQTYSLYKLTNYVPRAVAEMEGPKGFDVVFYSGDYYGIPHGLEEPEAYLKRIQMDGFLPLFAGKTATEVTDAINSNPYIGEFAEDLISVEEGYRGFNILGNQGSLYGILQADGKFDYNRLINGPYTVVLRARTMGEIKKAIYDYVSPPEVSPTLLLEDYKGFMVISLERSVYGFPKLDGPLPEHLLKYIEADEYYPVYTGKKVQEVIDAIDSDPYVGEFGEDLIFVEGGYKVFNILANQGTLYGILISDGQFDYDRLINGPYTAVLHARTMEELKKAIDLYVEQQSED